MMSRVKVLPHRQANKNDSKLIPAYFERKTTKLDSMKFKLSSLQDTNSLLLLVVHSMILNFVIFILNVFFFLHHHHHHFMCKKAAKGIKNHRQKATTNEMKQ
jgi:hypothetical protein